MPEIGEKIKSNVKDRIKALEEIKTNVTENLVGKTWDHLKRLEPGQALFNVTEHIFDGFSRFMKKQCEITRRWIGR